MRYRVIFSPQARNQLENLFDYIAETSSPDVALRYTTAIADECQSLSTFPYRGMARDNIRPGVRVISFKKRTVIAFCVDAEEVSIIGIFYGGQDYETALRNTFE